MKDIPQQTPTLDKVTIGKPAKKHSSKTWYGWLQGWIGGKRLVLGCIDLIKTGKLRINLHVKVYEKGKWPYFREEYQGVVTTMDNVLDPSRCSPMEFTVQIPLSMIHDIREEAGEHYGVRVRKLDTHQWIKKRYKR